MLLYNYNYITICLLYYIGIDNFCQFWKIKTDFLFLQARKLLPKSKIATKTFEIAF